MYKPQKNKHRFSWLLMFCLIFTTSCANKSNIVLPVVEDYDTDHAIAEKKHLRLGTVSEIYGKMYLEAIQPILAKKGYTVELMSYDDYMKPNLALAHNEIDLNIFQHIKYLNTFKLDYDLNLTAIAEIPTASMGIYSSKLKSLDDLAFGATVSIPDDETNLSRSLSLLESAGLIMIDKYVDNAKATTEDITGNPKNIQFSFLEAPMLVQSLDNHDLSVINGNFAISAGFQLSDALYNEILSENYINVIAVRTSDLDKQFVQDIIDAVDSDEFTKVIMDVNGAYSGFQLPR